MSTVKNDELEQWYQNGIYDSSESEANLKQGKISIKTPIAQGLLNKKVGDEVEIEIPRGKIKLRVDEISTNL